MTTFSAKLVFESKTTTAWGATVPAAGRLVVELDDGDGVTPVGLYYGNGVDTVAGLDNVLDQQSSATIAALAAKAPLASPTFTGTVTVPTGAVAGAAVNKAQLDALSGTYLVAPLSSGASAAANQTTIDAAVAQGKAEGKKVVLPPGTFNVTGPLATFDSDGQQIEGAGVGVTIINITSTTANGVTVAPTSITYGNAIRRLTLRGPSSGTGIGVHAGTSNVKNSLRLHEVAIETFGSHGLLTSYTDYLVLDQVRFHNNKGDGWYADTATNGTTVIGGAFGIPVGTTPPAGKAGIRLIDAEGLVFVGSEWGRYEYGFIIPAGGTKDVAFIGCRFEGCTVQHGTIGTGTSTPYPNRITFQNCEFLGDNAVATMVSCFGTNGIHFDRCTASQLASGGSFVKAENTNAKLTMDECEQNGGANIFVNPSAAGESTRRIVYGGDYTTMIQAPYALNMTSRQTFSASLTALPLGIAQRNFSATDVRVAVSAAIAADGANYWLYRVRRYSNGVDQGITASGSTTGGLSANRSATLTMNTQTTYLTGDVYVLELTKVGTPADLTDLSVMMAYRPLA